MKKILVVDDDELIHTLVNSALARDEYEIQNAFNVEEAIKFIDKDTFDILLTDIVMPPGEDGTKLMQYVREKHPSMSIIAMTGGIENAVNDYVNYARLFADQTLAKPFAKEQLIDSLRIISELEESLAI